MTHPGHPRPGATFVAAYFDGMAHDLVELDQDHPGFRDAAYRARRNAIARLALEHRDGEPIPRVDYTPEEHAVWRSVWQHLAPVHDRLACREYLRALPRLRFDRESIPQLADVDALVHGFEGFHMVPVAGLVSARGFLACLADSVFLSTQYIRHHSQPLYTPEPDIVHELVGHAATLTDPELVRLNRAFGRAARRAAEWNVKRLENAYWYTLEFGVLEESGMPKAYGAGLLSSFGELGRFAREAELVPLDLDRAAATTYDPTTYQRRLFVAPSFAAMSAAIMGWLETI